MEIKLRLPLRNIFVTQPYSVNYLDFYKKMNLRGHPGIDFRARRGAKVYAAHDGVISWAGKGSDGGNCVMIAYSKDTFGTMYYHNLENKVKTGDVVRAGDLIATADNTGKYTTADHLHFELYLLKNGEITDRNNGFNGKIDPAKYFVERYNGDAIKNKDYDKSDAYHRYGRKQEYLAEMYYRFTPLGINNKWTNDGRWVQKQLKSLKLPLLNTEQVNAIIYGGWDFNSVINPSMRELCAFLKKDEYNNGIRPFC